MIKLILFSISLLFISSSSVKAQRQIQYISVALYATVKDTTYWEIDTSGLNSNLKNQLVGYVKNEHKFKSFNQLLNFLGLLGWELIQIEHIPQYLYDNRTNQYGHPIEPYKQYFINTRTFYHFKKIIN